jgi:hypothetical protein
MAAIHILTRPEEQAALLETQALRAPTVAAVVVVAKLLQPHLVLEVTVDQESSIL